LERWIKNSKERFQGKAEKAFHQSSVPFQKILSWLERPDEKAESILAGAAGLGTDPNPSNHKEKSHKKSYFSQKWLFFILKWSLKVASIVKVVSRWLVSRVA
jgi:hypothetical protein